MKLLKITMANVLLLLAFSCNTNKNMTDTSKETSLSGQEKMREEGYKKATVVASRVSGDCPFTLKVEGETTLFDPVNLEENYKTGGKEVWVKYTPLRMANRCDKANPVEVIAIAEAAN